MYSYSYVGWQIDIASKKSWKKHFLQPKYICMFWGLMNLSNGISHVFCSFYGSVVLSNGISHFAFEKKTQDNLRRSSIAMNSCTSSASLSANLFLTGHLDHPEVRMMMYI